MHQLTTPLEGLLRNLGPWGWWYLSGYGIIKSSVTEIPGCKDLVDRYRSGAIQWAEYCNEMRWLKPRNFKKVLSRYIPTRVIERVVDVNADGDITSEELKRGQGEACQRLLKFLVKSHSKARHHRRCTNGCKPSQEDEDMSVDFNEGNVREVESEEEYEEQPYDENSPQSVTDREQGSRKRRVRFEKASHTAKRPRQEHS